MAAHLRTQMAGVPQVNPAVAEDHHKLCCLDLKGTSMKLIGAFKEKAFNVKLINPLNAYYGCRCFIQAKDLFVEQFAIACAVISE